MVIPMDMMVMWGRARSRQLMAVSGTDRRGRQTELRCEQVWERGAHRLGSVSFSFTLELRFHSLRFHAVRS